MLKAKLILAFIALWAAISSATEGPRVRLRVPNDDLRLNILRFSQDGIANITHGEIQKDRFYPKSGYNLAALGARDCSSLLDSVQRFPLQGMLQAKYISPETFQTLEHSKAYLDPERVTFANVYSLVKKENYDAAKDKILPSQLTLAPEFRGDHANLIPVTTATMYLVAGYKHTPQGLVKAELPWASDPAFAHAAPTIIAQGRGVDFELGRALQVSAGHVDYALKALLIALSQETSFFKSGFENVRVFVHSYKTANTAAYVRRTPSLKVVATDPNNPENVILMTTLAGIFSPEYPWDFSGPIQMLRDVDRDKITVPKAWNFLSGIRGLVRADLDYFNSKGERGTSPIVIQDNTIGFQNMMWSQIEQLGIAPEKYSAVTDLLNGPLGLSEGGATGARFVDPLVADRQFLREKAGPNTISISNLNPKDSAEDPNYELRVLFASVMNYGVMLESAKVKTQFMYEGTYSVSTTDATIAARLEKLAPSSTNHLRWQKGWSSQPGQQGITLSFEQTTARTFLFKFSDLTRLANAHPQVFADVQNHAPVRQGYFFAQQFIARPTGL